MSLATITYVSLSEITPTPDNPRHLTGGEKSLQELAASIATKGVLQPILLRPMTEGFPTRFELRAGERRWRAAGMAGLSEIPAIVREMTDDEALEVTLVENLQRVDVHPLEEAETIRMLCDRRGWSYGEIATQLGKSTTFVARRARLARLTPKWKKAVEEQRGCLAAWSTAMLEEVALFPEAQQDLILGEILEGYRPVITLSDLKRVLGGLLHHLKSAPWDLADPELLPSAGPCASCPRRTGACADLFEGPEQEERLNRNEQCLDAGCWARKRDAHVLRQREELGPETLLVGETYGDLPKGIAKSQVVATWDVEKVKSGKKPGAVKALVVNGEDAGRSIWVVPRRSAAAAKPAGPKTLAERRQALQLRRVRAAAQSVREDLKQLAAGEAWLLGPDSIDRLVRLIHLDGWNLLGSPFEWDADIETISKPDLWQAFWAKVLRRTAGELASRSKNETDGAPRFAAQVCRHAGLDWPAALEKATEAIPEPASWAKLNKDGTPKAGAAAATPRAKRGKKEPSGV